MKWTKMIVAAVLAPLLFLAAANADAGEGDDKRAASSKPSLTYYYFDG